MSWGAKISDFGPLCPPPLVVIGLSWCKFGQSAIQMMTSSQLWRTGRMAYKVQIPIFWWDMVMCEKTILVYWIVKTTSVICVCHCALCSHVLQNFLFSDIISTNYSLCQVSCFIFCLSSIFPDIFHWLLLTFIQAAQSLMLFSISGTTKFSYKNTSQTISWIFIKSKFGWSSSSSVVLGTQDSRWIVAGFKDSISFL